MAKHIGPARGQWLFLHRDTGWQAKIVLMLFRGCAFGHGRVSSSMQVPLAVGQGHRSAARHGCTSRRRAMVARALSLNNDPLDLIERDGVAGAVVELGRLGTFV